MASRAVVLSIITIFWALSFMVLVNLPAWIVGTQYEILVYVIWFLGFAVAYVEAGLRR